MRFARNAKVFRGQLDMAPFVSVFFLLLAFFALTAVIRTPGAPMRLTSVAGLLDAPKTPLIEVSTNGIFFGGHTYQLDTLEVLEADLKRLPRDSTVRWWPHPAAPRELVALVAQTIRKCGLIAVGGDPIQLPAGTPLAGVAGRAVVVAVDFTGQLYYNNQPVQEDAFKSEMAQTAGKYSNDPPPTLVLWADREVSIETLLRLAGLAKEAGINNVSLTMKARKDLLGRPKKPGKP